MLILPARKPGNRVAQRMDHYDRLTSLRPDPFGLVIPTHLALVAERYVFDVDEYFPASLAVPCLATRVAGVAKDGSDGVLRPGAAAADVVPIARRVVC